MKRIVTVERVNFAVGFTIADVCDIHLLEEVYCAFRERIKYF